MRRTILSLFILSLLSGCVKEKIELNTIQSDALEPSFAIPVGKVKLQIGRINDKIDGFFEVNSTTGLLEFIYSGTIFESSFNDLYQAPSLNFGSSIELNSSQAIAFNSVPTGGNYSFTNSVATGISFPGSEQVDSLIIEAGILNLTFESSFSHSVSVLLTIPSLIKNGIVYSTTVPLPYSGTSPVTQNINLPLQGYKLDLTDQGTTVNSVRTDCQISIVKGNSMVSANDSISFRANFNLSQISSAFGYLGNNTILSKDTVEIGSYFDIFGGTSSFAAPRIEMEILNSTGIPFLCQIDSALALGNTNSPSLGGPGLSAIPMIDKAPQIGLSTTTSHTISNMNTNPTLTEVLDEKPSALVFNSSVQMNPNGLTSNFITSDSKVSMYSRFVIPLNLWIKDFILNDTSSNQFSDILGVDSNEINQLKQISLRIRSENALPFESTLQIYFLDEFNNLIDSAFTEGEKQVLESPTINFSGQPSSPTYGKVVSSKMSTLDFILSKDKYINLIRKGQSKMVYSIRAITTNSSVPEYIKIYPNDYVTLNLSAKVDMQISFN